MHNVAYVDEALLRRACELGCPGRWPCLTQWLRRFTLMRTALVLYNADVVTPVWCPPRSAGREGCIVKAQERFVCSPTRSTNMQCK